MLDMAAQIANSVDRKHRLFIREWREHKRMSLDDVALGMGYNKSDLSKIERGIKRYNEDILNGVAEVFGIHPYQLFFPPTRKSLDDLIVDAPEDTRDIVFRMVRAAVSEPEDR